MGALALLCNGCVLKWRDGWWEVRIRAVGVNVYALERAGRIERLFFCHDGFDELKQALQELTRRLGAPTYHPG
jgi:hypothetical protein